MFWKSSLHSALICSDPLTLMARKIYVCAKTPIFSLMFQHSLDCAAVVPWIIHTLTYSDQLESQVAQSHDLLPPLAIHPLYVATGLPPSPHTCQTLMPRDLLRDRASSSCRSLLDQAYRDLCHWALIHHQALPDEICHDVSQINTLLCNYSQFYMTPQDAGRRD